MGIGRKLLKKLIRKERKLVFHYFVTAYVTSLYLRIKYGVDSGPYSFAANTAKAKAQSWSSCVPGG